MGSTPTGRFGKVKSLSGTIRKLAKRPSSNLGECGFKSLSCYSRVLGATPSDARWAARLSVKQPPFGNVGSIPTRGTGFGGWLLVVGKTESLLAFSNFPHPTSRDQRMARSSKGPGCQVVNLAMGVRFPYEPLVCSWPVRLAVQDSRFSTCKRGFDSPTGHSELVVGSWMLEKGIGTTNALRSLSFREPRSKKR